MSKVRRFLGRLSLLPLVFAPFLLLRIPFVQQGLLTLIETMRGGGAVGAAAYILAYTGAALFAAPIALMNGLAGFVYGPVQGSILAVPAVTLGGVGAFLVGRYLLRARLESRVRSDPRWAALDRLSRDQGFRISLLLRLTPVVPQNVLHFVLGVSHVRLAPYVLSSLLGLLPITVVQVYLGSLVRNAAELLRGDAPDTGPLRWILPLVALVVSVLSLVFVARAAKKALETAMKTDVSSPPPAPADT